VPSLDLRFAANRSLRDAVTGQSLVTFTRASNATVVGPTGLIETVANDVPRFQHDPTTGACLGLLVEEQRANLKTYSDAILGANNYGIANATLTSVSISTPLGGTTASLLALNVGANTGNSIDGFNFGSGTTLANTTVYTQSIFVRMSGASVFRLRSNVTGEVFSITPSSGAPAPSGTVTAWTVQPFRDDWFRISWTFTSTTTAPGNRGDHWTIKSDVADGVGGYHVTGAQLEAGAFPTSYIPTTGTSATRSADIATITGTAFSGWYNQGQGSAFVQAAVAQPASGGNQFLFRVSDNSYNNQIAWNVQSAGGVSLATASGGAYDGVATAGTGLSANVTGQIAAAYAANDLATSLNGAAPATDATATMPSALTRADIGSDHGALNRVKAGTISRIAYWPTRLSNATLQALTA
jgi:hypothetical protein